jgi:hypothetical protein
MDIQHKKLTEWCRKQIASNRREGKCVRLSLHHVSPMGKATAEIARVGVGDGLPDSELVTDIHADGYARELWQEAENYAEGIGDTQAFVACAYFEADADKVIARHAFRIHVEGEDASGIVDTEPGNLSGMVKQQMRHNEAVMRIMTQSYGAVLGSQNRHIERMSSMLEKLWEDKLSNIEATEELISAHHQRAMEMRQVETTAKIKEDAASSIMTLLPAIANKIIGKKILPETTDVTLQQVVKLAEGLSEEEFTGMLAALPPAKKIALIELMKTVEDRSNESEEAPLVPKRLTAVKASK